MVLDMMTLGVESQVDMRLGWRLKGEKLVVVYKLGRGKKLSIRPQTQLIINSFSQLHFSDKCLESLTCRFY